MPGFAFRDQCHGTQAEAALAHAAQSYPYVLFSGTGCAWVVSASVSGTTVTPSAFRTQGLCSAPTVAAYTPTFPSCDPLIWNSGTLALSWVDGGLVSGAIVGVWLLAWGWRAIYRVLWRSDATE